MSKARTVLITGCDRGLGLSMARRLAGLGWRVFAGRYMNDWPELPALAEEFPDSISMVEMDIGSDELVRSAAHSVASRVDCLDMIVNNAAVTTDRRGDIFEGQDFDEMMRLFNVNALGAPWVVEAFLPLIEQSDFKRLCFVSSEAGSVNRCERESWYGYCMSKAALNMGVTLLFNRLHPRGYTFRLYHPGWLKTYMSGTRNEEADMEADEAAPAAVSYFVNPRRPHDEDRLVMRDWRGREWPW